MGPRSLGISAMRTSQFGLSIKARGSSGENMCDWTPWAEARADSTSHIQGGCRFRRGSISHCLACDQETTQDKLRGRINICCRCITTEIHMTGPTERQRCYGMGRRCGEPEKCSTIKCHQTVTRVQAQPILVRRCGVLR